MRTPSARTASELKKEVTEPLFIVQLGLAPPVYLSTRGPTLYEGITYELANLEILGLDYEDNGDNSCALRLDGNYSQLVISGFLVGKSLWIAQLWGQEPFSSGDAIVLFDGVVNDTGIDRNWVSIEGRQTNAHILTIPALFYDHQNIQPAGTEITIRTNTYVIEQG